MFLDDIKNLKYNEYGWSEPLSSDLKKRALEDVLSMNQFIIRARELSNDYEILNLIEKQYLLWNSSHYKEYIYDQDSKRKVYVEDTESYTHFSLEKPTPNGKLKKHPVKLFFIQNKNLELVKSEYHDLGDRFKYETIHGSICYLEDGKISKFLIVNRNDKSKNISSYIIHGKIFNKTSLDIFEITKTSYIENTTNKIVIYKNK